MGSEGLDLVPDTLEHMETSWKRPTHSTEHARKGY